MIDNKLWWPLKIVIGAIILIIVQTVSAQDFTIYKDDETYKCLDLNKKLIQEGKAASVIQYALDHCASLNRSCEIKLGKGYFVLEAPIKLSDSVWLHGQRRSTELQLSGSNQVVINLNGAESVKISEITITSGDNNEKTRGIEGKCNNCLIEDVFFLGLTYAGVYFTRGSNGIAIDRSTFIDNMQHHIYIEGALKGSLSNRITNTTFLSGGHGIKAIKNKNEVSGGLSVDNNLFAYIKGPAIDSELDSMMIQGNRVYWCESNGMILKGNAFYFSGNTNSWIRGHGLVIDGAINGSVISNNITDLGARSRDGLRKCGIALYNSNHIVIEGNSIWNFGDQGHMEYAIYESPNCGNNMIQYNTGWFHAFSEGFKILGKETICQDNTSSQGEYRADYWDFRQKYGYAIDKYIQTLYIDRRDPPHIKETKTSLEIDENSSKIIECQDMLEQVLSLSGDGPIKFGWRDEQSQKWVFKKEGVYYQIINEKTRGFLGFRNADGFLSVVLSKKKDGDNQLWKIQYVRNGYFKIENKSNKKVLESRGLSNYSWGVNKVVYQGESVWLSDYSGRDSQHWRFMDSMPTYVYEFPQK